MSTKNELWQTDGEFWADDNAASTVSGTLTAYDDGHSELKLYDTFPGHEHDFLKQDARGIGKIAGHTRKYGQVILLKPMQINVNITSRGLNQATYTGRRLICSADLSHEWQDSNALELHASLKGLETWLGNSGFSISQDLDNHSIQISYVLPNMEPVQYSDDFACGFEFGAKGPTRTNPQLEVSIRQEVRLSIRSVKPVPLQKLITEAQKVADLINLGIGVASAPVSESALFAVPTTCLGGSWADLYFARSKQSGADIPPSTK